MFDNPNTPLLKKHAHRLILACGWCYFDTQRFTEWYDGRYTDGIPFGISKFLDGSYEVILQGSDSTLAWMRDFDILTTNDSMLGLINKGQAIGLDIVMSVIIGIVDKTAPIRVSGHSKGGAMAILIAGRLRKLGYEVAVWAFEPPRTMYKTDTILAEIYKDIPILITRNSDARGHDIVPDEPFDYLHPAEVTPISCPPVTLDPGYDMAYHHWQVIACGVALWAQEGQGI